MQPKGQGHNTFQTSLNLTGENTGCASFRAISLLLKGSRVILDITPFPTTLEAQPGFYSDNSTPIQAMSSPFLQEDLVGNGITGFGWSPKEPGTQNSNGSTFKG